MKMSKAAKVWIDYHTTHSKKNTVRSYRAVIEESWQEFNDAEIDQVTSDDVLSFLSRFMDGNLSTTQRYLGTISDVEAIRWIGNLYG